jgi:hypothetical protein
VCRRIFYIGGVELDGDATPDDAASQDAPRVLPSGRGRHAYL